MFAECGFENSKMRLIESECVFQTEIQDQAEDELDNLSWDTHTHTEAEEEVKPEIPTVERKSVLSQEAGVETGGSECTLYAEHIIQLVLLILHYCVRY